jgi:hypothetical protein
VSGRPTMERSETRRDDFAADEEAEEEEEAAVAAAHGAYATSDDADVVGA